MFRWLLCFLLFSISVHAQEQTIGLFTNTPLSYNGYTLWSPNETTYLIDNCGRLVHKWESSYDAALSVYLLPNGHLLRPARISGSFNGAGRGGLIQEFDWNGDLVWSFELADDRHQQHHDIEPLPNGNVLLLAWSYISPEESRASGSIRGGAYWSESVFEIEKTGTDDGKIVWEWHVWDHIIQDVDPSLPHFGDIALHPGKLDVNYRAPSPNDPTPDWLHFNSISYDADRDEIILSARNTSEIYIIDHSTTSEEASEDKGGIHGKGGDILYRWGNPEAYRRGTREDQQLFGQHDPRIIPDSYPRPGQITIFNNGAGRPGVNYSSIEIIDPPRHPDGTFIVPDTTAFGPLFPAWHFSTPQPADFYSNNMGGCQALPNGNILICESNKGRFVELTPARDTAWYYRNTVGSNGPLTQGQTGGFGFNTSVFRVTRYAPDYPAFKDRDLTPGALIEINPIDPDCVIYDDASSSSAGSHPTSFQPFTIITADRIIVKLNPDDHFQLFNIYNINGQKVKQIPLDFGHTPSCNIGTLVSGIYIMQLIDRQGRLYSQKVFIP